MTGPAAPETHAALARWRSTSTPIAARASTSTVATACLELRRGGPADAGPATEDRARRSWPRGACAAGWAGCSVTRGAGPRADSARPARRPPHPRARRAASPSATTTWPSPASRRDDSCTAVTTRLGPRPIAWSAQLEAVQSVAAAAHAADQRRGRSAPRCAPRRSVSWPSTTRASTSSTRTAGPSSRWPSGPHAAEYEGESAAGLRVTVGEGITGWVAATGQPLNVRDAAADPRAIDIPGSLDLTEESMLLAPLRSEGRVIGVVVLSRLGLDRFSDDELRLLGVLADQAAVAIENARLLAERDRHVTELAALLDLSQAGGGSHRRARAGRHCWPTGCAAPRAWTRASSRAGTTDRAPRHASARWPARWPCRTRDPAATGPLVMSCSATSRCWSTPPRLVTEPAERARLGGARMPPRPAHAALDGGSRRSASWSSSRSGPDHHFHAGEMAWLRTMANQAAAALENASLMRQLRDAAETDS